MRLTGEHSIYFQHTADPALSLGSCLQQAVTTCVTAYAVGHLPQTMSVVPIRITEELSGRLQHVLLVSWQAVPGLIGWPRHERHPESLKFQWPS